MITNTVDIIHYPSPAGQLILGSYQEKLCLCDWCDSFDMENRLKRIQKHLKCDFSQTQSEVLTKAMKQLDEYFLRQRTTFSVPLLSIGTDFQKQVWSKLADIPYGQTETYASLAIRVGNSKGVRAVASANGANLISIFLPCHRVIGSNRKLTGYSGGLDAKQILLELESNHLFSNQIERG